MSSDYIKLISRRLGLRMEIITEYPWDRMLKMCESKQVDGITSIVATPERAKYLKFSDPYFVSPYVIITRNNYPRIDGIRDLAGKKIAIEKGFYLHSMLQKDYPEISLHLGKDTIGALKAVALSQADAYVGNLIVVRYLINAHAIKGTQGRLSRALARGATSHRHPQ